MAALKMAFLLAILLGAPASADPVDRWTREITEASSRFHVPKRWIRHVILAESGGQVSRDGFPIVSRAGALGLMQLMPGTWLEMRAMLGLGTNPFNPRDNILAGTAYLRMMYDRFGYPGLFAAYNAGPGRYSDYLAGTRRLPSETKAYVTRIVKEVGETDRERSSSLFAVRRSRKDEDGAMESMARPPSSGIFVELDHGPAHAEDPSTPADESRQCVAVNPGCPDPPGRSSAFALP